VIQFAIYRLRGREAMVCRIQTDLGAATPFVLCAPVMPRGVWGKPVPGLHLPVAVDGGDYLIIMSQMLALSPYDLGAMAGDAASHRDAIVRAVDLLVTGF